MLNRLKDVFGSFQRHEVRYVVIGGVASVIHGVPRATFDLDILIDANLDNAQNLLDALLDAGLGTASLTDAEEVLSNEITIFKDRVRIDVQTSTPGLDFKEAWRLRNIRGRLFTLCRWRICSRRKRRQVVILTLKMFACWNYRMTIKEKPNQSLLVSS